MRRLEFLRIEPCPEHTGQGSLIIRPEADVTRLHADRSAERRFLRVTDFARAAAVGTLDVLSAVFRARTVTGRARLETVDRDLLLRAVSRFLEGKRNVKAYITAAAARIAAASAAGVVAEHVDKFVEKRSAAVRIAARARTTSAEPGKPRAARLHCVVFGAFLRVGQRFVCLVYFLEFIGSDLVARVQVGMVLTRKLTERAFYIVFRSGFIDAQYFVITFCHTLLRVRFLTCGRCVRINGTISCYRPRLPRRRQQYRPAARLARRFRTAWRRCCWKAFAASRPRRG